MISNKGSNIIFVSYKNHDPEMATLVLQELLSRYFVKHLEVHRSAGAFDFVTQQTDQVRARLNQTEDALKVAEREEQELPRSKKVQRPLPVRQQERRRRLIRLRRNSPSKKPLLIRSVRARQRSGEQKASHLKKARYRQRLVLPVSKQRLGRLRPSFAMFSRRSKQLSELAPQIEELERKREMDAANYKYFAASLEKARDRRGFGPLQNAQH